MNERRQKQLRAQVRRLRKQLKERDALLESIYEVYHQPRHLFFQGDWLHDVRQVVGQVLERWRETSK